MEEDVSKRPVSDSFEIGRFAVFGDHKSCIQRRPR